jgi:hypothetical protein
MSFLDGTVQIATEETCAASWGGGIDGKYFRCYLCGYKFVPGDKWRCVYTNDMPKAGGNPLICEKCDGETEIVRKKWAKKCRIARKKFWWFARSRG